MGPRAYEKFLRDAGKPIGWIVGIISILYFSFGVAFPAIGRTFASDPLHQQFTAACTLRDGTVEKVDGNYFCVKVTAHETIIPPDIDRYKMECREAGGVPKSRNYLEACYMYEIIEDLGPRDDYTGATR